jgi:TolB protein
VRLPFAAVLLVALATAALAQEPPAPAGKALPGEVELATGTGIQRFRLEMPAFTGDAAADATLRAVIRDDLFFTGLFELVPEGATGQYRIEGSVEPGASGQKAITFFLRSVSEGRYEGGKRYRGGDDALRRIGHKIAEEILRILTGQQGAFDTRIAYVSDLGDRRDVWVMDYDGASSTKVTNDGALVLSPEVSPDGQLLLFTSYVGRMPSVYVVKRNTGEIRKLLTKEGLNQAPAFSPDGSSLALSASFDGNSELYLANPDGSGLRRLTDHPAIDVSPAWSPTGQEIAVTSDRTGTPQIHVMTRDGLDVRRLTMDGAYNSEPAWSPDGTEIAYSSRESGRFQIRLLDVATGRSKLLTDGRANYESPSWSPDGSALAIASDRDGKYDIWIMRKDGTGLRRVSTRGANRFPHWYR